MDEPIVPFDLTRMFLGDQPALFYLEVLFRTIVIYAYTLVLIRWIGGRSIAQLSMVDLLLVIALGSAVGDATFYPDVPLLHAMMVITVVVVLNKLIDALVERYARAKHLIDGRPVTVVHEGQILPEGLAHRDVSPLEVKAMLRMAGVSNLGQVEAAYMEAGGGLSVFCRSTPKPGLSLVPPYSVLPKNLRVPLESAGSGQVCCVNCGKVYPRRPQSDICENCGKCEWTVPVSPQ